MLRSCNPGRNPELFPVCFLSCASRFHPLGFSPVPAPDSRPAYVVQITRCSSTPCGPRHSAVPLLTFVRYYRTGSAFVIYVRSPALQRRR